MLTRSAIWIRDFTKSIHKPVRNNEPEYNSSKIYSPYTRTHISIHVYMDACMNRPGHHVLFCCMLCGCVWCICLCMKLLVYYTPPGRRLVEEEDGDYKQDAPLCFICSGDVQAAVEVWLSLRLRPRSAAGSEREVPHSDIPHSDPTLCLPWLLAATCTEMVKMWSDWHPFSGGLRSVRRCRSV